jgi:hypothetical protein
MPSNSATSAAKSRPFASGIAVASSAYFVKGAGALRIVWVVRFGVVDTHNLPVMLPAFWAGGHMSAPDEVAEGEDFSIDEAAVVAERAV